MNPTTRRALGAAAVAAIAVSALSGCAATTSGDSSSGGDSNGGQASNVATDDYTPHVKQGTPVKVDNLTWRVLGASSTQVLGASNEFAREDAKGTFVVVRLSVKNGNNETANITSRMIKLVAKGKEYETDTRAEFALVATDSGKPFLLEDLGPDLSTDGTAVFDIPSKSLKPAPELCIGEMGFGPSQGCIALDRMS